VALPPQTPVLTEVVRAPNEQQQHDTMNKENRQQRQPHQHAPIAAKPLSIREATARALEKHTEKVARASGRLQAPPRDARRVTRDCTS
jgi:hypothetical protein